MGRGAEGAGRVGVEMRCSEVLIGFWGPGVALVCAGWSVAGGVLRSQEWCPGATAVQGWMGWGAAKQGQASLDVDTLTLCAVGGRAAQVARCMWKCGMCMGRCGLWAVDA